VAGRELADALLGPWFTMVDLLLTFAESTLN
jgi:hypothetical protein